MASLRNMRWTLRGPRGGVDNLVYGPDPATQPTELGPDDVRVSMHAASLNYRDIAIAKGSLPATQPTPGTVPGSDGAGVVHSVGSNVTAFRPGDKVLPHMVHSVTGDGVLPRLDSISAGLGQARDGTLAHEAVFAQDSLVRMPSNMSFAEAATLGCSGLTAWNALFGLRGRAVQAGDWVLVQGSGGVSIAALQLARAAGATVVATTGKGADVVARLTALGAAHVLDYKTDPHWGPTARKLTPDGRGFDFVVDVGGAVATLGPSLQAIRTDGIISLVGVLDAGNTSADTKVDMLAALWTICTVRGVVLGSKAMFRDMVAFCERHNVHPALDDVAFPLADTVAAYKRVEEQKHFSKVVIQIR
ncbi:zinc-type alcohol dehydrogenase-like protein [Sporothrix schenckii 1099-18]|uniref:Zinc-type alcohol dehydrogenase-like protein n=1 Tax=Sporothrix schenckii 1099-18 TaxID=1397361 RepID=A0A0F2MC77_SPOSC|nr:zinc-type alcohol dehydrogenase-like protein [Sporothrix schenckii 1099-18]KJR87247.1 zinc-type alcohol dehydrogenase-like protein [Sporothrix schenckii 1099-18]